MEERIVISKINEYLHNATIELSKWLNKMLPKITNEWWEDCVIGKLSFNQHQLAIEKNIKKLDEFDLAALLRIADKNWYAMRDFAYLPTQERECIREMMTIRNTWAHCAGELPDKNHILQNLETIKNLFMQLVSGNEIIADIENFIMSVESSDFETNATVSISEKSDSNNEEIKEKSLVSIVGQPSVKGVVMSISDMGVLKKYDVFVDGAIKTFYTGQIELVTEGAHYSWVDLGTLKSYLSAFEINNPSAGSLYSLNAARIDFVPYQFRPALKMIKSEEPRILIADSVGVGKTIEAGLIIKELEARGNLDNVMIICPKPLVSERKWELEMKRFDEEFEPLTGATLRQIINDTDRDGEWPARHSKTIVPYSILDNRVWNGDDNGKKDQIGLLHLDPAPHFDLVIIDEAHHIRNGSMEKEKAFAYKCVKYICDHADAVVMLTATPLQTGDDDLYTLLNVLRPDLVIDKAAFTMMSQPNEFISRCASIIRHAGENWQIEAQEELDGVVGTKWGENVIAENPMFASVTERLERESLSREDRVQLISDVESLHSFNNMINRTRRKDIQDFCIRRSFTLETEFNEKQSELHDALLDFERTALAKLHNIRSVPFMMSTIRRQAASCIFGLAPHLKDLINRRFSQIADDPDLDIETFGIDGNAESYLKKLSTRIIELADNLPEEDTKFDSMLEIIENKQKEENNKIILFSTFRYTLYYIKKKLIEKGYRVEQVDGSVDDEERCKIRKRFQLPRENENAYDILLFTEVGSEGLDYQFCNMMINYDLPWNPMRIEQRIGRIDRRGQLSEYVNIYNLITAGTVDADIYNRCLMRIGVFERSIGECEQILGEIGTQIEQIAMDIDLTAEERREKLEQMADNEVRRVQEMNHLEDEEKELFGFDFSNNAMSREIQNAESPWISPQSLYELVARYLNDRLGNGNYILGDGAEKTIRLSVAARNTLREDLSKISGLPAAQKVKWEKYLKGTVPTNPITFDSDFAKENNDNAKLIFITPVHPLIKQAAAHFSITTPTNISIIYDSETIEKGTYAFSIYAWNYVGVKPHFQLVVVCENDDITKEFIDIIQSGIIGKENTDFESRWNALEEKHIQMWTTERNANLEEVKLSMTYKKESLRNNFNLQKKALEQRISEEYDENIRRMKQSELENATERFEEKIAGIEEQIKQADIHTTLIANGIIDIR